MGVKWVSPIVLYIPLGKGGLFEGKNSEFFHIVDRVNVQTGLHISLLGMGLYRILRKCYIPAGASAAAAGTVLINYVAMVGWSASSKRACIMFLVWLGARVTGRTYDRLTALAAAAIIILFSDPLLLKEAAFQMSFLAILSLAVLEPVLCSVFRIRTGAGRALLGGAALQMGMLPCILYFYYQTQPWSILVNLAVVPLMTFIMGFGMAGGVLGIMWKTGGIFLGAPCHYMLTGIEKLCRIEQELPGAVLVFGRPGADQIVLYYLLISGALLIVSLIWKLAEGSRNVSLQEAFMRAVKQSGSKPNRNKKISGRMRDRFRKLNAVKEKKGTGRTLKYGCLLLWGIVSLTAVNCLRTRLPEYLEITCLDVGQGDGILIQIPSGENCIIDGGSTSEQNIWNYRIGQTVKFEGIREIDWWFVSHTDQDHISGLIEFLQEYEVNSLGNNLHGITLRHLVLPLSALEDDKMAELRQMAEEREIAVHTMQRGDCVVMGGRNTGNPELSCRMRCLAPEPASLTGDKNEDSLVLLLEYGKFRMLLTGDLEGRGEQNLLDSGVGLKADVLKVGHHGSKNASSETFLKEVHPGNAVLSYGEGNRYGHPSAETLERLKQAGCLVYGTAEHGAVTVRTDGYGYHIEGYLRENRR